MTLTPPPKTPNGVDIIVRQSAYLKKAFGKELDEPKRLDSVNELLLADNTTIFECASHFDFYAPEVQPVIRHLAKHVLSKNKYAPATIAKLLKYKELEQAKGQRGWAERVAARLNKEKVPTPNGQPWLAYNVSSLGRSHEANAGAVTVQYDGPNPALDHTPAPFDTPAPIPVQRNGYEAGRVFDLDPDLSARLAKVTDPATTVRVVHELVSLLGAQARTTCEHDDYDELKAKAKKWETMQSLMQEGK